MSVERHRRVKELFLAACELAAEERRGFLGRECGADAELRHEVEEMLAIDAGVVPALESLAVGAPDGPPERNAIAPREREHLARRAAARPYRVEGELGRGGMGVVLRVRDQDLRRELAMKVSLRSVDGRGPSASPSGSAADLARFLEEARITASLDHPGIVPVHDLGVDAEGRLYFTMKLVQGRELGEVLRLAREAREGWTRTRVVGVLLRVCEALAYAHDKGIVHRDLKASNVMVGDYGEVYVMDWGVARVLARAAEPTPSDEGTSDAGTSASPALTRAGSILGTPFGMAPEQARGEPVGPPADVYAAGALLYQVLAGRRPYEEEGASVPAPVVLARILNDSPRPLRELAPGAPRELVAIAERALARRVEERYSDMRALAEDLRAYLEGRVVQAYQSGALAELRKWVARNRLAACGIGATLLALAGGFLWSMRAEAVKRRELDLAADYFRARVATQSADELWPATPARVPLLEDWIARAETLLRRRDLHAERLRRLAGSPRADATETERQRALLEYLELLDGTEDGALLPTVRERLAFARTIEERSRTGTEAAARWREACASIRAGATHPGYAGLELAPQLGLVPLGPDPSSGLWEFAHLETGAAPARSADGRIALRPEHGLVFLLLPGGTFRMGAEGDPHAQSNERPAREVTLAPFFLSKHEMTQAQWQRCSGRNPSRWPAGYAAPVTAINPVEQVSWNEAMAVLTRMGLTLPTEARWEYACRAGTTGPFACDPADLALLANVADLSYQGTFAEAFDIEPFDDGFGYHAPVGSLEPNELGLHDMHGNVFEWVLDVYGSYALPRRAGDGLSLEPAPGTSGFWSPDYRVARGGNFEVPGRYARSSHRVNLSPSFLNHALGLRPAREIEAEER